MKNLASSTMPKAIKTCISLLLLGILAYDFLLCAILLNSNDHLMTENNETMIILGCKVMPSGVPSLTLKDRLDEALAYLKGNEMLIVVSGGQGVDEPVPEAESMANYLIANGVSKEYIIIEDKAKNTFENVKFSVELLEERGIDTDKVILVTNGFHVFRSSFLYKRVAGITPDVLAAPLSYEPVRLSLHLREPIAIVKSVLFDW